MEWKGLTEINKDLDPVAILQYFLLAFVFPYLLAFIASNFFKYFLFTAFFS